MPSVQLPPYRTQAMLFLQDSPFRTHLSFRNPFFLPRAWVHRQRGCGIPKKKKGSGAGTFLRRSCGLLFLVHEVAPPVLLPTGFVGLGAERTLLAIADGADTVRADAALLQCAFHRARTIVAQS
jgi:hypothetical protein